MLIRFWKPYGVLTQFTDRDGRPTLADYVPIPRVYSAGRLDQDSEGLLLLSDDGPTIARYSHPRFEHPKTYWAQVDGAPTDADLEPIRRGLTLADGPTRPATVRVIDPPNVPERSVPIRARRAIPTTWLELTLTEGRNRQVRRMTAAVGFPTLRLVRWAIGEITLAGLTPGTYEVLDARNLSARSAPKTNQNRKKCRKT
ncbi:MAG: pseudouridine synthase [Fimbriimonadaceae bacterium]|nr:pseudouridine synthase [Fimbriimonadaceae bacterium]